ncbi:hypothetical protein TSUD_138050 [Trifolium subterraneum]|uniref:RNase H type-1 domain-containing protein n=1 Tax=Trifolium subterraneum TaxID=3900 RepID=A0A2Z6NSY3_TRISU|nr:hypothetical protein TSUD_138050 [Trifolium subterraneum]
MSLCRNVVIPTHVLYADDIMVFCKATNSNIRYLLHIFYSYGKASGQVIYKQKSKFYPGSISNSRLTRIMNLLGFTVGSTPFNYLGCPIFVGTPKVIHFKVIADKIKVKLASWKGSLLSTMGRVQLVKSIIHAVMSTPRRFVRWLGFFSSNDQWAVICRSRYLKFGLPKNSFLKSSIWHGIKPHVNTVKTNTRWLLGSGNSVAFWLDKWLPEPLEDLFHLPTSSYSLLTARVSEYIENGAWNIPASIVQHDASIQASIDQIILPKQPLEDRLIWCSSKDGILSAKQAYMHLNGVRFNIAKITAHAAKMNILTSIKHNAQLAAGVSTAAEKQVLQKFFLEHIPAPPTTVKMVLWKKPSFGWIKANTDGLVTAGSAASGGLFRDYMANFRGAFAQKISGHSVLHSELTALILAMEIAHSRQWNFILLESDSLNALQAFDNITIVPWDLRNRWSNCFMLGLTLKWSHICREGNACTDKLVNIGHLHIRTRWWESLPSMLQDDFLSDRLGIPQYRTT